MNTATAATAAYTAYFSVTATDNAWFPEQMPLFVSC